MYKTICNYLW